MPLERTNDLLLWGATAFIYFIYLHMEGHEYTFLIAYRFYICGISQQFLSIVSMSQTGLLAARDW